jgi:hypothetical protein
MRNIVQNPHVAVVVLCRCFGEPPVWQIDGLDLLLYWKRSGCSMMCIFQATLVLSRKLVNNNILHGQKDVRREERAKKDILTLLPLCVGKKKKKKKNLLLPMSLSDLLHEYRR